MRIFSKLLAAATAAAIAAGVGALVPAPALAETLPGYPNALVESGVAARWQPYIVYGGSNTLLGYTSGRRSSAVKCWADGDSATGNYTSTRWFKVYVYNNGTGVQWSFVHSSYVYNQPSVPECSRDGSWRE
jgi:hypothetical protein